MNLSIERTSHTHKISHFSSFITSIRLFTAAAVDAEAPVSGLVSIYFVTSEPRARATPQTHKSDSRKMRDVRKEGKWERLRRVGTRERNGKYIEGKGAGKSENGGRAGPYSSVMRARRPGALHGCK